MKIKKKKILLLDITVQILLVSSILVLKQASVWFLFVGGAWQLISNYYHMKNFGKTSLRKVYWKIAWGVVSVLLVTGVSLILVKYLEFHFLGIIIISGLYTGLIGGGVLYFGYLLICGFDFVNAAKK